MTNSNIKKINAVITDGVIVDNCIYGKIYGDTAERFNDGEDVITSSVVSKEGRFHTTRSGTVYYVVPSITGLLNELVQKQANDSFELRKAQRSLSVLLAERNAALARLDKILDEQNKFSQEVRES